MKNILKIFIAVTLFSIRITFSEDFTKHIFISFYNFQMPE